MKSTGEFLLLYDNGVGVLCNVILNRDFCHGGGLDGKELIGMLDGDAEVVCHLPTTLKTLNE